METTHQHIKKCKFCKKDLPEALSKIRGNVRCAKCFDSNWRIRSGLNNIDIASYIFIFLSLIVMAAYHYIPSIFN